MSIIRCRECSREISDQAAVCPNCGVQVNAGAANAAPKNPNGSKAAAFTKKIGTEVGRDTSNWFVRQIRDTFSWLLHKINIFEWIRKK